MNLYVLVIIYSWYSRQMIRTWVNLLPNPCILDRRRNMDSFENEGRAVAARICIITPYGKTCLVRWFRTTRESIAALQ